MYYFGCGSYLTPREAPGEKRSSAIDDQQVLYGVVEGKIIVESKAARELARIESTKRNAGRT